MTITDAHIHIWRSNSRQFPWDRSAQIPPLSEYPVESLIDAMSRTGVDKAVLVQHSIYGYNNSYIIDCARRYPQLFSTIIKLDPLAPTSPERLRQLVEEHNIQGLRLHVANHPQPAWLASTATFAIWEMAARLQIVIGILLDPPQLSYAHEVISRFPEVRVVIDHLGRVNVDEPITGKNFQLLLELAAYPNVFVKVSGFYALSKQPFPYLDLRPYVHALQQRFSSQRLLWATDLPLLMRSGESYAQALDILHHQLPSTSEAEMEWMMGKAALQLFRFGIAR
ncbi:MAG: amidohydrolase family protein [Anaerolineae bacterium]|nr:amidohydrolase family protein [Anaerolineae bacterium]